MRELTDGERDVWNEMQADAVPVEKCLDCDGAGKYPSGQTCKSCAGHGHVQIGSNSVG